MAENEKESTSKTAAEAHSLEEKAEARSLLISAALIGIGALIEPELLLGMAIGAGIVAASKWLPGVAGDVIRPIAKNAIKAGYAAVAATKEIVAEVTEEVEDMMAEARAEHESREPLH